MKINPKLMHFKLVHYRLAPRGWKDIGLGLAESKSLRTFTVHGTNLAESPNMKNLFGDEAYPGMLNNTSIVTLNLADNDLRDEDAYHLLLFL